MRSFKTDWMLPLPCKQQAGSSLFSLSLFVCFMYISHIVSYIPKPASVLFPPSSLSMHMRLLLENRRPQPRHHPLLKRRHLGKEPVVLLLFLLFLLLFFFVPLKVVHQVFFLFLLLLLLEDGRLVKIETHHDADQACVRVGRKWVGGWVGGWRKRRLTGNGGAAERFGVGAHQGMEGEEEGGDGEEEGIGADVQDGAVCIGGWMGGWDKKTSECLFNRSPTYLPTCRAWRRRGPLC